MHLSSVVTTGVGRADQLLPTFASFVRVTQLYYTRQARERAKGFRQFRTFRAVANTKAKFAVSPVLASQAPIPSLPASSSVHHLVANLRAMGEREREE